MTERPSRAIEALRSWASSLHAEAPPRRPLAAPTGAEAPAGRRTLRVVAVAAAVAVFMAFGLVALADDAVPGDLLYPVDRAGEWIVDLLPSDVDRGPERTSEALVLMDRGEGDAAVELMLEYASDRLGRPAEVDDLLELLAALRDTSGVEGEQVRQIARMIGNGPGLPPGQGEDPATPPSTPGQGDPATPPSTPGQDGKDDKDTGPPDEPPGQDGKDDKDTGPPDEPPGQDGKDE